MTKLKEVVLPFEPIERFCKTENCSDEDFAQMLGITRKTIRRYRLCGLSFFTADKISCRLGHHPTYFWGDDYFGPIYHNEPEERLD